MTANTAPNTTVTVRPSRCLARHAIVRPARADMHRQYAPRQRSGPHAHNAWLLPGLHRTAMTPADRHQRSRVLLCAGGPKGTERGQSR